jgi:uncharacterized C2H2 Zn-finger protein
LRPEGVQHQGVKVEAQEIKDDFKCSKCLFVGSSKASLKHHHVQQHKSGENRKAQAPEAGQANSLNCSECSFVTLKRKSLIAHIGRAHKSESDTSSVTKKRKLQEVSAKSKSEKEATPLIENLSELWIRPSETPGFAATTSAAFDIHIPSSERAESEQLLDVHDIMRTLIQCPACQFLCNSLRSMGEHIATVHPPRFEAPVKFEVDANPVINYDDKNNNKSIEENSLICSMETKLNDDGNTYSCSGCSAVYSKPSSLKRHLSQRHRGQSSGLQPIKKSSQENKDHNQVENSKAKDETASASLQSSPKVLDVFKTCLKCNIVFSLRSSLNRHNNRFHSVVKTDSVSSKKDAGKNVNDKVAVEKVASAKMKSLA